LAIPGAKMPGLFIFVVGGKHTRASIKVDYVQLALLFLYSFRRHDVQGNPVSWDFGLLTYLLG
jgi:hypothetical protein